MSFGTIESVFNLTDLVHEHRVRKPLRVLREREVGKAIERFTRGIAQAAYVKLERQRRLKLARDRRYRQRRKIERMLYGEDKRQQATAQSA
jgi:hypothetical protein